MEQVGIEPKTKRLLIRCATKLLRINEYAVYRVSQTNKMVSFFSIYAILSIGWHGCIGNAILQKYEKFHYQIRSGYFKV